MKCKIGYIDPYQCIEHIKGTVNLDSLDVKDIYFKNNTEADTIYFFNLRSKLTETGIAKIKNVWADFDKTNEVMFVNIICNKPLTIHQKTFRSIKLLTQCVCYKNLCKNM